ncbi:MAG TPA: CBS domain-containing protein, partial [Thermomicrobiales bacterium]|nr:CBS domain-containing protein [Thermomicrobiales bacterium]
TTLAADVLEELRPGRELQVFDMLEPRKQARLLALMAADDAADLVGRIDPAVVAELLPRLPDERAQQIVDLLGYPSDSAGGIMTNDEVTVSSGLTVAEARSSLRERIHGPDFVYFTYVVDHERERRLRGVLTLRDLMSTDAGRSIDDLMTRDLITIAPSETATAAARRVLESQLLALPVIDDDRRLLGVVTVDAAIERVAPSRWRSEAPRLFA